MDLSLIRILFIFVSVFDPSSTKIDANGQYHTPIKCFITATTIENLIDCWDDYVPPKNFISNGTWNYFAPTNLQKRVWNQLINEFLSSDSNCTKIKISSVLEGVYGIKAFYDKKSLYCALYEISTLHKHFRRGWGLLMVPFDKSTVKTNLHISVSHPFSDGLVHVQAASLFTRTGARSLLISGLRKDSRYAKSKCRKRFFASDGSRDNGTMFHQTAVAIKDWQMTKGGGCPWSTCAFVQFHGKGPKTCQRDTVLLSAGVPGSSLSGKKFYANSKLPVNRLKKALLQRVPKWNVVTPDDSRCKLTGVTNTFGKILNRIPSEMVCHQKSKVSQATGHFIHIEQAPLARRQSSVQIWTEALLHAFAISRN